MCAVTIFKIDLYVLLPLFICAWKFTLHVYFSLKIFLKIKRVVNLAIKLVQRRYLRQFIIFEIDNCEILLGFCTCSVLVILCSHTHILSRTLQVFMPSIRSWLNCTKNLFLPVCVDKKCDLKYEARKVFPGVLSQADTCEILLIITYICMVFSTFHQFFYIIPKNGFQRAKYGEYSMRRPLIILTIAGRFSFANA